MKAFEDRNIAIIRSSQQFLASKLNNILAANGEVTLFEYEYEIKALKSLPEDLSLVITFVDGETTFNSTSIVYLKDYCIEHDIPVIIICYPQEETAIKTLMAGAMIQAVYIHPVEIKVIANKIISVAKEHVVFHEKRKFY